MSLGWNAWIPRRCRGRSTVQEDGMAFHHVLQDIPDDGLFLVHYLLGRTDGLDDTPLDQFPDDERLVQLGRHQFGEVRTRACEARGPTTMTERAE